MSRIATGDWDAVIVPQSFVNMMPDDPARMQKYLGDQLAEMKAAQIAAAAEGGKKSPKAADLQRAVEKLEKQITNLADRAHVHAETDRQRARRAALSCKFPNPAIARRAVLGRRFAQLAAGLHQSSSSRSITSKTTKVPTAARIQIWKIIA